MRIGIDARAATEVSAGRGRYVRELLIHLQKLDLHETSFTLYCRTPWKELKEDQHFFWQRINVRDPLWHIATARHANRHCNVFLSTNSYLTAWFTQIPCVVMTHDMIPFIAREFAQKRSVIIERLTIKRAVKKATHFICNSNATRIDLERLFPLTKGRTTTIYLAANKPTTTETQCRAVKEKFSIGKPFVLAVGTIEPRKNLLRLLQAWRQLPDETRNNYDLVFAGPPGWQDASIRSELLKSNVHFLGYVSEEELSALYKLCSGFCYPSLYEGFGLPILEAMQSGTAIITSNVSSLPEIAKSAAHYVDPYDVSSISNGINDILTNKQYQDNLANSGIQQAREFSWETTAIKTLQVLKDCAINAENNS